MSTYLISKLSFRENEKLIDTVKFHELDLTTKKVSIGEDKDRNWLVQKINQGHQFWSIGKNPDGRWKKASDFIYENNLFTWGWAMPQNITKRKTFISYHHKNDSGYKDEFINRFGDLVVNKSVNDGDIKDDNKDEYIKQLIQQGHLYDTTVLVVLLGTETQNRKHIDWEIAGALNRKVGDNYAGLLGILLPSHPDYGKQKYSYTNLPIRLAENLKTGYAIIIDWTEDRTTLQSYIEQAFRHRKSKSTDIVNRAINQFKRNR